MTFLQTAPRSSCRKKVSGTFFCAPTLPGHSEYEDRFAEYEYDFAPAYRLVLLLVLEPDPAGRFCGVALLVDDSKLGRQFAAMLTTTRRDGV